MASVPNTRAAPLPVPSAKTPALAKPAGFARQLAGIPEELLQIPAAILGGGEGDAPAPDGNAKDAGAKAETAAPADAPSDAAQLAALAPLLQSLPAVAPAPLTDSTEAPVPAPAQAAAAASASAAVPAPAPATRPKVATAAAAAAAATPAPTPLPAAATPEPLPNGKIAKVKAEAQTDETAKGESDNDNAPALDATAKQVIAAAKRTIEAALRGAGPALAEAAPKAARIVASALQSIGDAPRLTGGAAKVPIADIAESAALTMPAAPAPAPAAAAQPRDVAAPAADRTLNLADDTQWLDRLARDIAQASGNEGTIRFRLNPQTLGHLRVELSQGDHGTSVRLTTDTEHARSILADAQPRLVAEARAQGVRIAETHVDLSGSDRNASGDPRRQDETRQTPLIRTARDAAVDADAPERPSRSRSDRYA